ncbi:MAG TPA: Ni/Fe hydrogenase subunit alpha [Nocardioidaceae bacterium]|nr:Ni/Fe hydrogenase subunit alpha [Nocardioidaceae bacterium]
MTHAEDGSREITVETLARVEGEGGMRILVEDGKVADVQLRIYEPPRFFEALLRGRGHTEPPDITSRICGICPVAYEMSACLAIEDACGVVVPEEVRLLRRLLYCGEWIESHTLHVYLLHLPDFLGYPGVVEMSADHRELVERGLRLKHAGNALMSLVGGRAVHPVNVRVGGFYRLTTTEELAQLRPLLVRALDDALATVTTVAALDVADFEQDYEYVALRTDADYPIEAGAFVTSSGRTFPPRDFDAWVTEQHVEHSNALHARLRDVGPYVVGPLARYSLNHDHLPPTARQAADAAGLGPVCRNPFRSIVVRAVELVTACEEALRIIDGWSDGGVPSVPVPPRAGVGYGATEAPRGVLYHRYELAEDGTVLDARIVPPTSQNLASIELDLRAFVQPRLDLDLDELTRQCEQAVRNYDPCISCATHFLDLTVEHG